MALQRRTLGRSGIQVSQICLGSMTWGSQNDAAQAASQIDCALDAGVDFIDTAEMYPTTPMSADTQGLTESIIGGWLKASGRRDDVRLATKVVGNGASWMIGGGVDIDGAKLRRALDGSLARLNTDHVDLYQLHWPNRGSYHFRKHWQFDPSAQSSAAMQDHVADVLHVVGELQREGKLRAFGLSNESVWGTQQFLSAAERNPDLPRVVTVQNEYSLMCRLFDTDFAEFSHHEDVGLLAFSPLAAGMLSGKYVGGQIPAGSRRALNAQLGGRWSAPGRRAMEAYAALARERGLDPAQLAIAFCLGRPFMTSVIVGATSVPQLQNTLAAVELELDEDLLAAIDAIRRVHPLPL